MAARALHRNYYNPDTMFDSERNAYMFTLGERGQLEELIRETDIKITNANWHYQEALKALRAYYASNEDIDRATDPAFLEMKQEVHDYQMLRQRLERSRAFYEGELAALE